MGGKKGGWGRRYKDNINLAPEYMLTDYDNNGNMYSQQCAFMNTSSLTCTVCVV